MLPPTSVISSHFSYHSEILVATRLFNKFIRKVKLLVVLVGLHLKGVAREMWMRSEQKPLQHEYNILTTMLNILDRTLITAGASQCSANC